MNFEPVIGLEVHAQLLTASKIFCGCSTRFGAPPNENTCPVCLGLPGALPVLNQKAVELALKAALSLKCQVPPVSLFARKNYFYPDLPKGYQISQYDQPLAIHGFLNVQATGSSKKIRIRRIHLEEDAGKLLHEGVETNSDGSFIDLNRSGVPLIEIVTEPDLRNPEEAHTYLRELRGILRYSGVSHANMEEGNLRCDANISLRPEGNSELGTKVEIKNLNSFRNVQKALEFEIERQTRALLSGETVNQETRLFDAAKGITEPMRSKEEAHDYRYFPEPDLLPLPVSQEELEKIKTTLPELPPQKRERFVLDYQLTNAEAATLTEENSLADFFEEAARLSKQPKQAANWILRDLLKKLKDSDRSIGDSPVSPKQFAEFIDFMREGTISTNQGKELFEQMWETGKDPATIVKNRGMSQISNADELSRLVREILAKNPELVERYKRGEVKLHKVLVGQVMKASGGKANPALVDQILKQQLS